MINILNIYNKKEKILFVGSYPPPIGGVSIHIQRLISILRKVGFFVSVFDTSRKFKAPLLSYFYFLFCLFFKHFDVLHIHQFDIKKTVPIVLLKKLFKYKIYYTDHNSRLFVKKNKRNIFFIRFFINNLDVLVLVGEHLKKNYTDNKINLPENTIVQNAFLPPNPDEEFNLLNSYINDIREILKSNKPILIANASHLIFFKNEDLYGLDLCIELTKKLVSEYPDLRFIFTLANKNKNLEYFNSMQARIYKLGIQNNFYILAGQKETWPLIKNAHVFLRPTNTDGDAISIREALYFNVPVIASDACIRPDGVTLFKNRNLNDLYIKTMICLKSLI